MHQKTHPRGGKIQFFMDLNFKGWSFRFVTRHPGVSNSPVCFVFMAACLWENNIVTSKMLCICTVLTLSNSTCFETSTHIFVSKSELYIHVLIYYHCVVKSAIEKKKKLLQHRFDFCDRHHCKHLPFSAGFTICAH